KAASRLAKAFRERKVTKIYRAVVEGDATKAVHAREGRLTHQLKRDEKIRFTRVVESGGKEARLWWRVLSAMAHRTWLEIELETGLSHQIRCQLAAAGHPIVGDKKYGARQRILNIQGTIALYCYRLKVKHPTFCQNPPSLQKKQF
ncbi:MAG: RNA pseudouridine synthase, partial [Deltaproteobacteria bacterium]|nr:RNA pseudouridine synthase [Deltaproteobacteria bacterium]